MKITDPMFQTGLAGGKLYVYNNNALGELVQLYSNISLSNECKAENPIQLDNLGNVPFPHFCKESTVWLLFKDYNGSIMKSGELAIAEGGLLEVQSIKTDYIKTQKLEAEDIDATNGSFDNLTVREKAKIEELEVKKKIFQLEIENLKLGYLNYDKLEGLTIIAKNFILGIFGSGGELFEINNEHQNSDVDVAYSAVLTTFRSGIHIRNNYNRKNYANSIYITNKNTYNFGYSIGYIPIFLNDTCVGCVQNNCTKRLDIFVDADGNMTSNDLREEVHKLNWTFTFETLDLSELTVKTLQTDEIVYYPMIFKKIFVETSFPSSDTDYQIQAYKKTDGKVSSISCDKSFIFGILAHLQEDAKGVVYLDSLNRNESSNKIALLSMEEDNMSPDLYSEYVCY